MLSNAFTVRVLICGDSFDQVETSLTSVLVPKELSGQGGLGVNVIIITQSRT